MGRRWLAGALAALGWAGWLSEGGQQFAVAPDAASRSATGARPAIAEKGVQAATEREAQETAAAANLLGLGAAYLEDATQWELSFFDRTLQAVLERCPRGMDLLYHYTDIPGAKAILSGRRGLRLSRGGFRGGGVFFSRLGPLVDQEIERNGSRLWRDAFGDFKARQLRRNYGTDTAGRERKVDAVLLCVVPRSMLDEVPDREDAVFIAAERFETFGVEYFSYRNIPKAYRLAPAL